MKMYMLRNAEGQYLNTDYHSRWKHGNWRSREDARLYKSQNGIRSALYGIATPSMRAHAGMSNYRAPGDGVIWTDQDREAWRAFNKAIAKIKGQLWWDLLAKDGYVLEEVEI